MHRARRTMPLILLTTVSGETKLPFVAWSIIHLFVYENLGLLETWNLMSLLAQGPVGDPDIKWLRKATWKANERRPLYAKSM